MAATAASMAIGIFYTNDSLVREAKYRAALPYGAVYVDMGDAARGDVVQRAIDAVSSAVPVKKLVRIYSSGCSGNADPGDYCALTPLVPAAQRCFLDGLQHPATVAEQRQAHRDERCDGQSGRFSYGSGVGESVAVDGVDLLAAMNVSASDLEAARKVIDAGGVVVGDPRLIVDGKAQIAIRDSRRPGTGQEVPEEKLPHIAVPAHLITTGDGSENLTLYSPRLLERVGFRRAKATGFVAVAESVPDRRAEDRIRASILPYSLDAANGVVIERGPGEPSDPRILIATVLAGLITLGAAGIATGLAAADGRADLATLAAVGASPGLRRRLSLTQAGVIAGLGSFLGSVSGAAASLAVLLAQNEATKDAFPVVTAYPLEVAWPNVVVASAVPLVAMLGAGLLTRSRLPAERSS